MTGSTYHRLLGVLVAMGDEELVSLEVLMRLMPLDSPEEVEAALLTSLSRGDSYTRGGRISITLAGRETYGEATRTAGREPAAAARWRDEALTGIDSRGRRTRIDRGVLPGQSQRVRDDSEGVAMVARVEQLRRLSAAVGRDMEELAECAADGSLRVCTRCGVLGVHRPRGDRGGHYSWCRSCESADARERYRRRSSKKQEEER